MGGVDFGRRSVRWIGRIVGLGYGVPSGYERGEDGEMREVFPRRPGARVEVDLPQHGKTEVHVHEEPIIIPLDELTPIRHSAFWCMHCNDVFCERCEVVLAPAGADYDGEIKTGVRWCSQPECVRHEASEHGVTVERIIESRVRYGRKAPRVADGAAPE